MRISFIFLAFSFFVLAFFPFFFMLLFFFIPYTGNQRLTQKSQCEQSERKGAHPARPWRQQTQACPGRRQSRHGSGNKISRVAAGKDQPEDK